MAIIFVLMPGLLFAENSHDGSTEMKSYLLLDDFTGEKSTLNTDWEGFTDQVMGGISEISVVRIPDADGNFIRMIGKVSLENNGGFIQVRLKLAHGAATFDASSYSGIRLVVRGVGTGYYIFLRTSRTILPWKYYAAPVPTVSEWRTADIPWDAFKPGDYGRMGELKVNRLKSIALVAYGEEFDARIDLKEIGLY